MEFTEALLLLLVGFIIFIIFNMITRKPLPREGLVPQNQQQRQVIIRESNRGLYRPYYRPYQTPLIYY
jgi:hypothetical protein